MFYYDEQYYLQANPDVAEAVKRHDWPSGMTHFAVDGYRNRRPSVPKVDEEWYLATYPLVASEMADGSLASIPEHYYAIGRYRGYLPSERSRRPDNPSRMHSRFGGFWTDAANALDVVAGRFDLGKITLQQMNLLQKWITDGYVVLQNAIPEKILAAAEEALDDAYHGKIPGLRYAIHGISENCDWDAAALTSPAKALDLHWVSPAVRDLVFSDPLLEFMHLVFERRALASQTLGFWRGSAQSGHQDSAYVNYSLPLQFTASWIALEDVKEGAGELFYYVGSHRMPEFLYGGDFKGAEVAKHVRPGIDLSQDYPRHIELIKRQAEGLGLKKERFLARRGDVLFWNADLAHGGSPISGDFTRKSIVTHYCPKDVVPAYFENAQNRELRSYDGKAFYSASNYR